ncbi:hypothetical protein Ocin01_01483 [Orchesella cincta]|uniref:Fe2OG dioxygenase domain-containing protein n=1 Tax=Orchesella cincta TaxID=48709 RepID=A0A1D2NIX6_ORCCI|nr:hypothetical protein Ocin01_01483 [Orchesella cincta]
MELENIPIVDLARLKDVENIAEDPDWKSIAENIRAGLGSVGFLYLINHGIPEETVSKVFRQSQQFFSLPSSIKAKYAKNTSSESEVFKLENYFGYQPPGGEQLHPDAKFELKETFDWLNGVGLYPSEELPSFEPSIEEFDAECKKLLKRLLRTLAIGLNLDDVDFFLKTCRHFEDPENNKGIYNIRLIRYPAIAEEEPLPTGAVRCGEHSDYGFLTLLFQDDVGGLEVKNLKGEWVHAKPIPGSILVNTGDLTEFWTCGIFPATPHRIIIPEDVNDSKRRKERYSVAFFNGPDKDTVIHPVDMEKKPQELLRTSKYTNPNLKDPVTAYDHMMRRIANQYGN